MATGLVASSTTVYFGPSSSQYPSEGSSAGPNDTVQVLWKEGSWYYIDYPAGTKRKRMYIPTSAVSQISGTVPTYTVSLLTRYVNTAASTYWGPNTSSYNAAGSVSLGETVQFLSTKTDGSYSLIEYSVSGGLKRRAWIATQYLSTSPIASKTMKDPINKTSNYTRSSHADIAVAVGTAVYAMCDGTFQFRYYWGKVTSSSSNMTKRSALMILVMLVLLVSCIYQEEDLKMVDPINKKLVKMLSEDGLSVSNDLVQTYYSFNREFPYELKLLPTIKENLNWEELTHFVMANVRREDRDVNDNSISADTFNEVVLDYFGQNVEPGDSKWLRYLDGRYVPTGWDDILSVRYRLTEINKNERGEITAVFDGIHFQEQDFFNDAFSPNMRAFCDFYNMTDVPEDFEQKLSNLFSANYKDIFFINEILTVRFRLKNSGHPFLYTFCERIISNE
jgi:hypothetical protein